MDAECGQTTLDELERSLPQSIASLTISSSGDEERRNLSPTPSFVAILQEMEALDDNVLRPEIPIDNSTSLVFQQLDVREYIAQQGPSSILIFGITEEGATICVRVAGFLDYLSIPISQSYDAAFLCGLEEYINDRMNDCHLCGIEQVFNSNNDPLFLKMFLDGTQSREQLLRLLSEGHTTYENLHLSSTKVCESSIGYVMRFMADSGSHGMEWLSLNPAYHGVVAPDNKLSSCQYEIVIRYRDFLENVVHLTANPTAPLRILSFDIETDINLPYFPQPHKEAIIQISNMLTRRGGKVPFYRSVLTLHSCEPIAGADVQCYDDENDLITAWLKFVRDADPDVIIGYNSSCFDIPYIIRRAKHLDIPCAIGRIKDAEIVYPQSHSLGNGDSKLSKTPMIPGRIHIDLLRFINVEQKKRLSLQKAASQFLNDQKEDLHYTEIPALQRGTKEDRTKLAVYCLKDAYLTQQLLDHLDSLNKWIDRARQEQMPFNFTFAQSPATLRPPQKRVSAKRPSGASNVVKQTTETCT